MHTVEPDQATGDAAQSYAEMRKVKSIGAVDMQVLRALGLIDTEILEGLTHGARQLTVDVVFSAFHIEQDF